MMAIHDFMVGLPGSGIVRIDAEQFMRTPAHNDRVADDSMTSIRASLFD